MKDDPRSGLSPSARVIYDQIWNSSGKQYVKALKSWRKAEHRVTLQIMKVEAACIEVESNVQEVVSRLNTECDAIYIDCVYCRWIFTRVSEVAHKQVGVTA